MEVPFYDAIEAYREKRQERNSFKTPLVVSPMPDGRKWRLVYPFTYHIGSEYSHRYIQVPAGFITDFASFPVFLWRFLMWWLPMWAKYNKAPIVHDYLYQSKISTRKEADDIFLEAMLVSWKGRRFGKFIACMEYWGVRLFGWLAWR